MSLFAAGEVLTAAKLNAAVTGRTLNEQTASAYALQTSDVGKIILMSGSVEQVVTIPAVSFTDGSNIAVFANGNAAVSVVGASGVTINSGNASGSAVSLVGAYGSAELFKVGDNEWTAVVSGAGGGGEGLSPLLLIGA